MGANAQTSVPAFTSGQVLTASQVTQINTGIPVFASSTERDAAFGGAGEKTLAEGQMAYLEDTNETQVYDGSAWAAVGASGVVLLDATDFTNVSSVSIDNVFSSTYSNYTVMFSTSDTSDASVNIRMRLRVGGVDEASATNFYRYNRHYNFTTSRGADGGNYNYWYMTDATNVWPDSSSFLATLFNPGVAQRTTGYTVAHAAAQSLTDVRQTISMFHKEQTAYDGFPLYPTSGTITGKVRVYGMVDA